MPAQAGAPIGGRSFNMTAHIDWTSDDEGVLYATGTQNSGISMFIKDRSLVFDYNAFDDHTIVRSPAQFSSAVATVGVELLRQSDRSASVSLMVDGEVVATGKVPWLMGTISSVGASVGYDAGSPVSQEYEGPIPILRQAPQGGDCTSVTARRRDSSSGDAFRDVEAVRIQLA